MNSKKQTHRSPPGCYFLFLPLTLKEYRDEELIEIQFSKDQDFIASPYFEETKTQEQEIHEIKVYKDHELSISTSLEPPKTQEQKFYEEIYKNTSNYLRSVADTLEMAPRTHTLGHQILNFSLNLPHTLFSGMSPAPAKDFRKPNENNGSNVFDSQVHDSVAQPKTIEEKSNIFIGLKWVFEGELFSINQAHQLLNLEAIKARLQVCKGNPQ